MLVLQCIVIANYTAKTFSHNNVDDYAYIRINKVEKNFHNSNFHKQVKPCNQTYWHLHDLCYLIAVTLHPTTRFERKALIKVLQSSHWRILTLHIPKVAWDRHQNSVKEILFTLPSMFFCQCTTTVSLKPSTIRAVGNLLLIAIHHWTDSIASTNHYWSCTMNGSNHLVLWWNSSYQWSHSSLPYKKPSKYLIFLHGDPQKIQHHHHNLDNYITLLHNLGNCFFIMFYLIHSSYWSRLWSGRLQCENEWTTITSLRNMQSGRSGSFWR